MQFVYVDESGDLGQDGSPCYTLGVLLVDPDDWYDLLEEMIDLRRQLRQSFGIRSRAELKAYYLVRAQGPIEGLGLSRSQRKYIWQQHFDVLARSNARVFAVVVDKAAYPNADIAQIRSLAWQTVFQRLERANDKGNPVGPMKIINDDGDQLAIRKLARAARRHLTAGQAFGTGTIKLTSRWLVEDPSPRNSADSYFIQLADLIAYAAWRGYQPGGSAISRVCPQQMWMRLGPSIHKRATALKQRSLPGIVVRN